MTQTSLGPFTVQVQLIGYHEFTICFSFKMDGKNEIGSITNYDSIIHDGQEMGRGKSAYTFETLGLFYQSLVDTGKPINAEVFSKLHGNKTRLLQVK